ncbi:hypothetical protein [Pelagicoccus sp. SDUM812003]|uniref:hypothetical protein n=1 Tax=Pelagicoccus sp. SDUM812003 TaxID=3041267 RepID=UPI00280E7737|nr:hypothetical protein [Pelagicoccus sp. SDUM812003]MDQ8202370.1 hypothetical protein [Pelagicoccus sp. SDUM812003]
MSASRLETPVAFFAFNRPDQTKRVFEAIRRARPTRLFVVLDGPRKTHPTDTQRVADVREAIESRLDWPCQIDRLYAEENMGCGRRVSSGLDYLFSSVEQAIILEDDCLPAPSFFPFCEELLSRYQDDESVMQIAGSNLIQSMPPIEYSYYPSRHGPIWGWASWRRAWKHYDYSMASYASCETRRRVAQNFPSKVEQHIRMRHFRDCHLGKIDTWDFQWLYAKIVRQGRTLIPKRNLVENIGFDSDATHTTNPDRSFEITARDLDFPLVHPRSLEPDRHLDELYFQQVFLRHTSPLHKAIMTLKETVFPTR